MRRHRLSGKALCPPQVWRRIMMDKTYLQELKDKWFPHVTDAGLNRLTELLDKASPLLIHGSFTRAVPMGCLATHVAWNHPQTAKMTLDAGICWLNHVAGLNPATSLVIRDWDRAADCDYEIRADLAAAFRQERESRRQLEKPVSVNRIAEFVNA